MRARLRPLTSQYFPSVGAWRSLVAHLHGVQGVAGSNPVAPTIYRRSNPVTFQNVPWALVVTMNPAVPSVVTMMLPLFAVP
jgi:hypothetical protein